LPLFCEALTLGITKAHPFEECSALSLHSLLELQIEVSRQLIGLLKGPFKVGVNFHFFVRLTVATVHQATAVHTNQGHQH